MRVEPELPDHPKFLRLERRVGDVAAKLLLRLWGHCQMSQRGGSWKGADAEYVEIVCRWAGQAGLLYGAFKECGIIHKVRNGIVIHDWDVFNSKAKAAWENGAKGGRPSANPAGTQPEPNSTVRITHSKPTANPSALGLSGGKPTDNQLVSESVSESVSGSLSKKTVEPDGWKSDVDRKRQLDILKTKHAALNAEALELRDQVRAREIDAAGAKRLQALEMALKKVRKKQAEI